ncbi:chorismate lyase [Colwellia sp. D2M02]|uniref:chorismate--pyruvate lyase family protein n=1 Tax=Colwellia sp. D2M02 TaxID=2841562 RepID=UPI001C094907|nr:chorismate lyase [Colwellia sp. D2M02]MBU2894611.1 chorismate lyase [Colwellia sp. D2M02]
MSQPHPLFPVTLASHWHDPSRSQLTHSLLDWLLDSASLTARLKKHCTHFSVELLGQKVEACSAAEATAEICAGEQVLVREVLLHCDHVPQVFARSLLPLSSLTGEEQHLANLGTQSLGQVLFSSPLLTRKKIHIASFDKQSSVGQLSQYLQLAVGKPLWGRRSTFMLGDKPLVVAEVFLPQAFAYQQTPLSVNAGINHAE